MRSHWVDVNLDMYDYMEARVEALAEENRKLQIELKFLKELDQYINEITQNDKYPMPSMLVC